jgi:hypothetical protein
MKFRYLSTLALIAAFCVSAFASTSGEDVLRKMHGKYAGKWYKTLTFVQKTTYFKPDGTTDRVETWYEAMSVPGSLRIDIADSKTNDGMIFTGGKLYQFREGKAAPARPFVHPLLVLGFDIYQQPIETSIEQVKGIGIDLTQVHETKWQGRDVYVVGTAAKDDLTKPQVWIDKQNLYFVRLIELGGRDKKVVRETQFNKYFKSGGGWVAPEVLFFVDGKPTITEEYTEVRTNVKLDSGLWDPEKWATADRTYWKKK